MQTPCCYPAPCRWASRWGWPCPSPAGRRAGAGPAAPLAHQEGWPRAAPPLHQGRAGKGACCLGKRRLASPAPPRSTRTAQEKALLCRLGQPPNCTRPSPPPQSLPNSARPRCRVCVCARVSAPPVPFFALLAVCPCFSSSFPSSWWPFSCARAPQSLGPRFCPAPSLTGVAALGFVPCRRCRGDLKSDTLRVRLFVRARFGP